jgi:hypothetical protein
MAAEIAHLPLAYPPMPHLEEDTNEEVDSTGLESWPMPPSTPPTGDDMHPLTKTFCASSPGNEWMYNTIDHPKYFRFLIPDLSIPRCQIVAPWIKYDLNPVRPSISGTYGQHHTVITRPLRPTPVDYHCPLLTPEQTAILRQDEPYSDIINYII